MKTIQQRAAEMTKAYRKRLQRVLGTKNVPDIIKAYNDINVSIASHAKQLGREKIRADYRNIPSPEKLAKECLDIMTQALRKASPLYGQLVKQVEALIRDGRVEVEWKKG